MQDAFGKPVQKRTGKQNNAMHKYFDEIATMLNESGISVPVFLNEFEIDYSKEMVKSIWRAIAKKKYGIDSTADLTTRQLQDVFEEFNRHVAQHGMHLPFPSSEMDFDEDFLQRNGIRPQ